MASMAHAGLRLSIAIPMFGAIGQSTTLSISSDATIAYLNGYSALLLVDAAKGSIDYTSGIVVSVDSGMAIEHGGDAFYYLGGTTGDSSILAGITGYPTGANGVGFYAFNMDTTTGITPATLFSDIKFTSNSWGNAVVTLYYVNPDFDTLTYGSSVVIGTLPEPMTLGLFGIGGLFLRRRK